MGPHHGRYASPRHCCFQFFVSNELRQCLGGHDRGEYGNHLLQLTLLTACISLFQCIEITIRAVTDLARACSEGAPSPQLEALIHAGLTDAICTCIPRLDNLVPSTFAEKRGVRTFMRYLIFSSSINIVF